MPAPARPPVPARAAAGPDLQTGPRTGRQTSPPPWPRPPHCLPAARLQEPPENARITVAGLVILRQRPGTAKGVIFVTLEDETGVVNVIVWRKIYEAFRRAVISGRMLRVTGRLQRAHSVTHVIAEDVEDISPMLDLLLADQGRRDDPAFAPPPELG
ncbi:OB-fold nucleic acid binding domain-containing protein [Leisingera sp. SS27]|uniref:OB-fold nucleic acid binding domain-containing protein n=1 Tax=Leisingera sp. SS27 TaxID=2979462 RepID=UPI00232F0B59|nr:OB-fold nucleic acid binding domain-containing protein [Leisingera sp. SS27]MDC0659724.1 OB-fold nucleic acid binding domain-containing protein [Leisingera sp. SS27]